MLTFELEGVKAALDRFDDMQQKIEQLQRHDLAEELGEWETGDMNRKRAYVKRRFNGASTLVRKHSWWETKGRRKAIRKLVRKGRYTGHRRRSTRPVLRPQLLDQLQDRIEALAEQSLRW